MSPWECPLQKVIPNMKFWGTGKMSFPLLDHFSNFRYLNVLCNFLEHCFRKSDYYFFRQCSLHRYSLFSFFTSCGIFLDSYSYLPSNGTFIPGMLFQAFLISGNPSMIGYSWSVHMRQLPAQLPSSSLTCEYPFLIKKFLLLLVQSRSWQHFMVG